MTNYKKRSVNAHPRKHPKSQVTRYIHTIEAEDRGCYQHSHMEDNLPANLAEAIRARFAPLGDVELELPPREPMREPPDFE